MALIPLLQAEVQARWWLMYQGREPIISNHNTAVLSPIGITCSAGFEQGNSLCGRASANSSFNSLRNYSQTSYISVGPIEFKHFLWHGSETLLAESNRYGDLLNGKGAIVPKKQAACTSYPTYVLMSRLENGRRLLPQLLAKGGKRSSAGYGLSGMSSIIIGHFI